MTAPTCMGHGRNKSTPGVGTSVVDHVLRVRRGATGGPTLPLCVTLDHETHGPALQLLASDHCPVIFFCGPRTRAATVKRSSWVTWRLELLHQQHERDAYKLAVRGRAHTALALLATEPGDQHGIDRMASADVDMLTGSAMSALGRRTIVTGIIKGWFTPAVKTAARRRRAALRLMLCRPYDAAARSDMTAANQEFTAAVRDARRAHRNKLERTCARLCRASRGSYVSHKSLERLAAAPRSQGIPSLRHPETWASCTTDAAKAAALAAFTAAIARAHALATQDERASVARAHAAPAAERARPGHDAHGLGVESTFDEVRGCMRSLKNHKAAGCDGIPAELPKYSGGAEVPVLTHLFNAILVTRCVPSAWRLGIVLHLAKCGDARDCSNYRPLTLLLMVDTLFA